ncbi:glycosyltransferase [Paenibacillus sp. TRM 82003]|nr:glycosyltransferase [Paenibacillus sp. TRM 82003]
MAVVIYPPTIDWDWMKQRPQQLMEQFARDGHEVYYCNKTQLPGRPNTDPLPGLTIVHDNKAFIRQDIPRLKREGKKLLVWATCSKHYIFLEQYLPDLVIYDYVDDFPIWAPYFRKMLDTADIVFATARSLKEQVEEANPLIRCELVPNGVSLEQFRSTRDEEEPMPEDFPKGDGPVIGYVGAWAHWVDGPLVELVAERFPEARIVLIGPEFGAKANFSTPNLHYLGLKPHDVLRRYVSRFDACIIPFSLNGITHATNPVKMYEYLASGKPVVSTDLPETRGVPHVYNGATHEAFIEALRRVLSPDFAFDQQRVDAWLSAHTWRRRYEMIRATLADQFPELLADTDGAPVGASELTLLMDRVRRKIELAAEAEPYILTTYLRNLENTLSSMLRSQTVQLHRSDSRQQDA